MAKHDKNFPAPSHMTGLKGTETVSVDAHSPNPRNARTHNRRQIKKIAASIERFGFVNPVLIDADRGIIAGHGRVEAAKQLGSRQSPHCVWSI